MPRKDDNLKKALREAESKKMYFVFIPKGSEGKLIVAKSKIPSRDIAKLKKETAGGTPVAGKCIGPLAELVFQIGTEPPPALSAAIDRVAHRDAGLTIVSKIRVDPGADAEEHEGLLTRLQLAQFFGANRMPGDE